MSEQTKWDDALSILTHVDENSLADIVRATDELLDLLEDADVKTDLPGYVMRGLCKIILADLDHDMAMALDELKGRLRKLVAEGEGQP